MAARALWSGDIAFGLVNIPVRMYLAARRRSPRFHQICRSCMTRIHLVRRCEGCDRDLTQDDVLRAYEYERGRYVVVTDEELQRIGEAPSHTIAIEDFVDLADVDPLYFVAGYYLTPAGRSPRAYNLLRTALAEAGKAAIGRFVLRRRSHLAVLRARDGVIVLHTMHYADEVSPVSEVSLPALPRDEPSRKEVDLALELVRRLSTPFDPAAYEDTYRKAVEELVNTKVLGREVVVPVGLPPPRAEVVDLMEALRRTLEEREAEVGRRGAAGDGAGEEAEREIGQERTGD